MWRGSILSKCMIIITIIYSAQLRMEFSIHYYIRHLFRF
nr:MAG TPA: hypothetical protein [Crassvirales sp.]